MPNPHRTHIKPTSRDTATPCPTAMAWGMLGLFIGLVAVAAMVTL